MAGNGWNDFKKRWIVLKMAGKPGIGQKQLEMAGNGQKWQEMAGTAGNVLDGWKQLDSAGNGWKVLEIAGMADMPGAVQKWLEIDGIDKWKEMAGNGRNGRK